MKRIFLTQFYFILLVFLSSTVYSQTLKGEGSNFTKINNGVLINTGKGQVSLTVFNDNIIHFIANPIKIDDSFSSKIVEATPQESKWKIVNDDKQVGILTKKLKVMVDLITGAVSYYDIKNKILLSEPSTNARIYGENNIYGNKTQFAKQAFIADKGEAFYGMGQNHNDKLNIKGSNLDLWQQNTEITIPLMVSSKNYGVLWDNYSHSKFGSLKDANLIPNAVFEDYAGNKGKLNGAFFTDSEYKNKSNKIDWDGSMLFNENLKKTDSIKSIRLTGTINIDEAGEYEFIKEKMGKLSLYIDGKRVMELWQTILATPGFIHLNLSKGKHKITIEYMQQKGEFPIIKWRKPSEQLKDISIWSASAKNIDYYFIYGENSMDSVVSGFRKLTGKASLLPKWAYGFWHSRDRYKTQNEIVGIAKEFRDRRIPIDNIVQDWHYWGGDNWGNHKFKDNIFPEPQKMMDEIHKMNLNLMISVWPKFYPETDNYKELEAAGAMYTKYANDKRLDFRKKLNSYYDPYNATGRKIYWNQINKNLYKFGIDAWWLDASEPAFDKNFIADTLAYYMEPNAFGKGYDYLNLYALFNSKAVYDGQRLTNPDKRVFILTRSSFAGMQKYAAAAWSGDIAGSWDMFKQEITSGLNFSLSGMPYWTDDVGGYISEMKNGTYFYDEYNELFTRWFQFSAFCPIFRVHGSEHEKEMWFFKGKYYDAQLKFNKLRYRLMPYIYSVAGDVTHKDYTMMRGLVFDFPNDANVLDITDQYMFGPSIMACPVTAYQATEREVYLPINNGGWYDFWTGKYYDGGKKYTIAAPIDEIPLFVKAGSIIPFGPEVQYTSEKTSDSILLRVYKGADATFSLYEDEGLNYNYEKGKYAEIKALWSDSKNQLAIATQKGMFEGMLKNRKFQIEVVSKENPVGYNNEPKPSKILDYSGKAIKAIIK